MKKINFEDGQLTKRGYVVIDGKEYLVNEAQYDGATPLSSYVLNKMQDNIEEGINNIQALPVGGTKGQVLTKQSETNGDANWEDIEANEVFIGNEEEAPETAKIIVEDEDFEESAGLSKAEVYVGAEEPTAGEKVWFRKGKNYLDISKLKSRTTYGITFEPTATGIKITGTAQDVYAYGGSVSVELKKGKTYMLYGNNAGNTFKLELRKGSTIITTIKTSGDKVTFTPSDNINIVTFVLEGISKGTTYDYEITNIQIEPGSSATPYEAYIEPQIYVRNSNGVYEEYKEQVTAINEINLNSKFSFASAYPSINPIVEKINNIVHISAIIKYDSTLPTSQINVGNLPLEYSPNTQQVFMCGVGETQYAGWNINRAGYLAIHSNGAIVFRTDSANVSYIFINITYFTD